MLKDYLEITSFAPVFIGDFNPVIIQPYWLANKKLIREEEATNAKIDVIHNEIVRFNIDWATIEITKERFEIRTTKEPFFEPVRDLAISILEILKETPVKSLGLNYIRHYRLDDLDKIDRYFEFGNKLAPLDNWSGFLKKPRLQHLEIIDHERDDRDSGFVRIKIQPSELVKPKGIAININDHFTLKDKSEEGRKGEMVSIFKNNYKASLERVDKYIESLWEKIKV